ncbi:MAG: hypothetical protein FJ087_12205 [Deltaproteobacteria bacterium]|nr:hypothetical protein [Deltaproteobacteria bacterium]
MTDDGLEVEEGQEVVRRTIVGGRPRARHKRTIRVPIGLEKVLVRAAGDPVFRAALTRDRVAAIEAAGYEMLATELSVLASVPDSVLQVMIGRIDVKRHGTRRFMRGVAAAAFASAAATATVGCDMEGQPAGIQPDAIDPADSVEIFTDHGVDRGILPDTEEWEPAVELPPEMQAGVDVAVPEVFPDAGVQADVDEAEYDMDVPPAPGGVLPDMPEDVPPRRR